MNIIEGTLQAKNAKFAIIISRFNDFINSNLLLGSLDVLKRIGFVKKENISILYVPGAYEIPIIANNISRKNKYNAIIALGAIIKGQTDHFKYISNHVISQLLQISLINNIPISLGILTTNTIEQAIERAGTKIGNKGKEAALCALEMTNLIKIMNNNIQKEQ